MGRRWTIGEERQKLTELKRLYVRENKTIGEIGHILGVAPQTVFQRLRRLGLESTPARKITFAARRRSDIRIPAVYTPDLAEFFGIMLGDGRLAPTQIVVTLGTKEAEYARYVVRLMKRLFGVRPKIGIRKRGYRDVYLGSMALVEWFRREGLVHNKVQAQVGIPRWVFAKASYMSRFLRGFFDTDGSVYLLRFGSQLSFTNRSTPLLNGVRQMLQHLSYQPSRLSAYRIYLTRHNNLIRFFKKICPANLKHRRRFAMITHIIDGGVGRPVGGGGRL